MANYSAIKGFNVETIAGDPANPGVGQVWYNSTSGTMKAYGYTLGAGSWSAGGTASTIRRYSSIAGTQTAAVTTGGSPAPITATELYNGTSWTTSPGTLNSTTHNTGSLGTQTAAMALGGASPSLLNETWNGSSWSVNNNLNTVKNYTSGSGTTTAGMCVGGTPTPATGTACELYNGSTWTETNNFNTPRGSMGHSSGPQTAVLICGGDDWPAPGYNKNTESWNGTSWTEVNDLNIGKRLMGSGGIQTSMIVFGGQVSGDADTTQTEQWNGTSWTEVADLGTGVFGAGGCGTIAASLSAFGGRPASTLVSEEWTAPSGNTTKTFTAS